MKLLIIKLDTANSGYTHLQLITVITWQRLELLLKLLDIGRICGQIVMCYLQLNYGTGKQVVCYLEQQR